MPLSACCTLMTLLIQPGGEILADLETQLGYLQQALEPKGLRIRRDQTVYDYQTHISGAGWTE